MAEWISSDEIDELGADVLDEPATPEPEPAPAGPAPETLARLEQAAQTLERFYQDPQFARQMIAGRAQQLGLQVGAPEQQQAEPPADYVDRIRQRLDPNLQFLAPSLAKATWDATQASVAPLRQSHDQQREQQRQQVYQEMVAELADEAPDWQRHEGEMLQVLSFLRGAISGDGPMRHPKYGSALQILHSIVARDGRATAQAARRAAEAVRHGTQGSQGAGQARQNPDLEALLSKAKTPQEQWGMAFRHALRENGVR